MAWRGTHHVILLWACRQSVVSVCPVPEVAQSAAPDA